MFRLERGAPFTTAGFARMIERTGEEGEACLQGAPPHRGVAVIELAGRADQARLPLQEIEAGQRILPHAIKLEMVQNADGTLAPLTPESTKPTITVYTAAGITATKRYSFRAPPA